MCDHQSAVMIRRMGLALLFCVACVFGLLWFFVYTVHGQSLDAIAYAEALAGPLGVRVLADAVLGVTNTPSMMMATALICAIALVRRRAASAVVAGALVLGANVSTQLAKMGLPRSDIVPDGLVPAEFASGLLAVPSSNSLPSGHATAAAAVSAAMVLVLPPRIRGVGGLLCGCYGALAAVATLTLGWHRPSDAIASQLVVGLWTCAGCIMLLVLRRHSALDGGVTDAGVPDHGGVSDGGVPDHGGSAGGAPALRDRYTLLATRILVLAGGILLVPAVLSLWWTSQHVTVSLVALPQSQGLLAYGGSAAGVAGVAVLLMAGVLQIANALDPLTPRKDPLTPRKDPLPSRQVQLPSPQDQDGRPTRNTDVPGSMIIRGG